MTPNPKEALERIVAICTTDQHSEGVAVGRVLEVAQAALATKPDGEQLEAIAKIIDPLAAELRTALDNAEGEPPELRLEAEAKWKARNDAALTKADLILVSGLVQDEAAIRADEREKCASIIPKESLKQCSSRGCESPVTKINVPGRNGKGGLCRDCLFEWSMKHFKGTK